MNGLTRAFIAPVVGLIVLAAAAAQMPSTEESLRWFRPDARPGQLEYERILSSVPTTASLSAMHDVLSSAPHVAGTPGDERVIRSLEEKYRDLGLEIERHDIEVYLSYPVEASLEIILTNPAPAPIEPAATDTPSTDTTAPVSNDPAPPVDSNSMREVRGVSLPLRERVLDEDPDTSSEDLFPGWNAYSATGDVTAGVVYANYGTKADFKMLADLDISVEGKIVIARYGGNFRGFKAKFAEAAGAVGLIIYTDPEDSGYRKGPAYPEGGWANETYIQRGSIKTLPYPGDPLTPFVEATPDAERLDADSIDLPRIPVQPVGWAAAQQIMSAMHGDPLPRALRTSWQGGLPITYRLRGGPGLELRLRVEQRRELRRTANVLASLRGREHPEQLVILGCHHDAWSFGAGDPNAGSIVLHEIARCFAEAAKQGRHPARTIVFANWAAEEYGIIGSTEWVESRTEELRKNAVAYINLDMAAMGPNFRSSAAPLLRTVILDAARTVPSVNGDSADTGAGNVISSFGSLGGGSDHVGFYCHLGIPSAGLSAGGSDGVSYHSNYETLTWYRQVVGDDYKPAIMLSRIGAVMTARLANAAIVPLDPRQYASDIRKHLGEIHRRAGELGVVLDLSEIDEAVGRLERTAMRVVQRVHVGLERKRLSKLQIQRLDTTMRELERSWVRGDGLPDRPWYRSLYAATDPDSGYGAWMLPGLRAAVESGDDDRVQTAVDQYARIIGELTRNLAGLSPTGD